MGCGGGGGNLTKVVQLGDGRDGTCGWRWLEHLQRKMINKIVLSVLELGAVSKCRFPNVGQFSPLPSVPQSTVVFGELWVARLSQGASVTTAEVWWGSLVWTR